MVLSTAFSQMFGIDYPIVSAPMDLIAGGELAAAVSGAGGLGLIGGGYGDRDWLARQFDLAAGAPVGCGFITWSLARQPQLLDLALQYEPVAVMLSFGDPAVFADAIKSAGTRLVCQIQNRTQAERALLRRYPWPQGHTMSVLSNALTDQFEDTELDILHREEAMARYWRAVAARDYSIANVTAG